MTHVPHEFPEFVGGPMDGNRAPKMSKGYDALDVQFGNGIARYVSSWDSGDYVYIGTRIRSEPETTQDEDTTNGGTD